MELSCCHPMPYGHWISWGSYGDIFYGSLHLAFFLSSFVFYARVLCRIYRSAIFLFWRSLFDLVVKLYPLLCLCYLFTDYCMIDLYQVYQKTIEKDWTFYRSNLQILTWELLQKGETFLQVFNACLLIKKKKKEGKNVKI